MQDERVPVTIAQAADKLSKPERTVRTWASRYRARKLWKIGKTVYYDWHDLKTIARQLYLGEQVPETPEGRDDVRAGVRATAA